MTMSDRMIGNLSICDKAYRLSTGMGAVARPRGVRPAGLAVNEGLGSPAFTGGLALAFGLTTAVLIMASVHWWRATGHGPHRPWPSRPSRLYRQTPAGRADLAQKLVGSYT